MNILFDHQIFTMHKIGGVSRYFCELIKGVDQHSEISCSTSTRYSDNEYLLKDSYERDKGIEPFPTYKDYLPLLNFNGKELIYKSLRKVIPALNKYRENYKSSVTLIKKQNFDIFHPTYYDPYFLNYIKNKPFVLTVFDLIHELFPNDFPSQDKTATFKAALIKKASAIIAISENTKSDIVKIYGVSEDKIHVVHLAPSLYNLIEQKPSLSIPKKYLLYVGLRDGYKNFRMFIFAAKEILKNNRDLGIVCTGHPFTIEENNLFKELDINKQIMHIYVNDAELKYLYTNALAFVFPSKYEGFGIPILESFTCGCPAVISSGSSMDEVGGDAACYFNPVDKNSISGAIEEIIKSTTLRNDLIKKGMKRVRTFSWERTVHDTIYIYKNLLL